MNDKVYKTAKQFIKSLKGKIDFNSVEEFLNSSDIKVMLYNSPAGDIELARYNLQEKASKLPAFTYCGAAKIIFIDSNISYEEKLYALLHETGHILLGHIGDGKLYARNRVLIDVETNAFAYHVLHPQKSNFPKFLAICVLILCVISGALFIQGENNAQEVGSVAFYSDAKPSSEATTEPAKQKTEHVLVTPTGTKFHRPDCRYVKNKDCESLTRSEALEKYAPCSVCKP